MKKTSLTPSWGVFVVGSPPPVQNMVFWNSETVTRWAQWGLCPFWAISLQCHCNCSQKSPGQYLCLQKHPPDMCHRTNTRYVAFFHSLYYYTHCTHQDCLSKTPSMQLPPRCQKQTWPFVPPPAAQPPWCSTNGNLFPSLPLLPSLPGHLLGLIPPWHRGHVSLSQLQLVLPPLTGGNPNCEGGVSSDVLTWRCPNIERQDGRVAAGDEGQATPMNEH